MFERCGDPVEVSSAILFLLSEDTSFLKVADLAVDGGYQGLRSEGLDRSSISAGAAPR
jgi:NAD(P)-dependent dehydrogenase (short-subunit alcohol dehydrogenase family)